MTTAPAYVSAGADGGLLAASTGTSGSSNPEAMFEASVKEIMSRNIGGWLGPFIIGWSLDFILYGIIIHQFILWVSNARTEPRFNQVIVFWAMLAGTACSAYSIWFLWDDFVLGFGVFSNLVDVSKLTTYGVFDPITLVPAQIFFIKRAYRLCNNAFWVPLASAPLMALGFAGAVGAKVAGDRSTNAFDQGELMWTSSWLYLWVCGNLFLDLFSSCTIAWGLKQSTTDWATTGKLIKRLIRVMFETALPGTIVFLFFLPVFAITRRQSNYATAFFIIIHPKVHVLSILAVLNYRFVLRKALGAETSENISTSGPRGNTFALSNRQQQQTMALDNIKVDTYVYEETYVVPEMRVGINRRRHPDEESVHSCVDTINTAKEDDQFNSTTVLHQPLRQGGSRDT